MSLYLTAKDIGCLPSTPVSVPHTNTPRPRINQGHDGGLVAVPYCPDQRIGAEDVRSVDISAETEQDAQHSLCGSNAAGTAGWRGCRLEQVELPY